MLRYQCVGMSAIDTIKHRRIGLFYDIPVYQPLESGVLGYRNLQDEHRMPPQIRQDNIDVACILIGGGSGEHPAIIFHDIEHGVALYIDYYKIQPEILPDIALKTSAHQGYLQTIQYSNWTNQDHVDFRKRCSFRFDHFVADLCFEHWLLLNVGEFVFHLMPAFSKRTLKWKDSLGSNHLRPLFDGITIPYGPYYGNGNDRFRIVDDFPVTLSNV